MGSLKRKNIVRKINRKKISRKKFVGGVVTPFKREPENERAFLRFEKEDPIPINSIFNKQSSLELNIIQAAENLTRHIFKHSKSSKSLTAYRNKVANFIKKQLENPDIKISNKSLMELTRGQLQLYFKIKVPEKHTGPVERKFWNKNEYDYEGFNEDEEEDDLAEEGSASVHQLGHQLRQLEITEKPKKRPESRTPYNAVIKIDEIEDERDISAYIKLFNQYRIQDLIDFHDKFDKSNATSGWRKIDNIINAVENLTRHLPMVQGEGDKTKFRNQVAKIIHDELIRDKSLMSKSRMELQEYFEEFITTKNHKVTGWAQNKHKWISYPPEEERIPERWFEDEGKKLIITINENKVLSYFDLIEYSDVRTTIKDFLNENKSNIVFYNTTLRGPEESKYFFTNRNLIRELIRDKELVYSCKKVGNYMIPPDGAVDFENKMINLKNLGETSGVYVSFNDRERRLILKSRNRVFSLNYNKKLPGIVSQVVVDYIKERNVNPSVAPPNLVSINHCQTGFEDSVSVDVNPVNTTDNDKDEVIFSTAVIQKPKKLGKGFLETIDDYPDKEKHIMELEEYRKKPIIKDDERADNLIWLAENLTRGLTEIVEQDVDVKLIENEVRDRNIIIYKIINLTNERFVNRLLTMNLEQASMMLYANYPNDPFNRITPLEHESDDDDVSNYNSDDDSPIPSPITHEEMNVINYLTRQFPVLGIELYEPENENIYKIVTFITRYVHHTWNFGAGRSQWTREQWQDDITRIINSRSELMFELVFHNLHEDPRDLQRQIEEYNIIRSAWIDYPQEEGPAPQPVPGGPRFLETILNNSEDIYMIQYNREIIESIKQILEEKYSQPLREEHRYFVDMREAAENLTRYLTDRIVQGHYSQDDLFIRDFIIMKIISREIVDYPRTLDSAGNFIDNLVIQMRQQMQGGKRKLTLKKLTKKHNKKGKKKLTRRQRK